MSTTIKKAFTGKYKQIGNAVPPLLGFILGTKIQEMSNS